MSNPFQELSLLEKRVFETIMYKESVTKEILSKLTKTTPTTLNRIMKKLFQNRLIEETGIAKSTGGRRPSVFAVNSSSYYLVGVDISRAETSIVLTNMRFEVLDRECISMDGEAIPEKVINQISKIIKGFILKYMISDGEILAVGVGTVGPLDLENGRMINPTGFNALGWENVELKVELSRLLNIKVLVDNGANTALLGEIQKSKLDGEKVAYFNIGKGIRSAFYSGKSILRATNNLEDAFAHMTVSINGVECHCGNRGCLECYCTVDSIKRMYFEKSKAKISFDEFIKLYDKGDYYALEVIDESALYFATGLANFINILGPKQVIISGPIVRACDSFFEVAKEITKKKIIASENEIKLIKTPLYKKDAIAVGACAMCIHQLMYD